MVAADDGIELAQNGNRTAVFLAGKTRLHASDAPARFIVEAERIKGGTNFGRSFLLFKAEFRLGKNGMTKTDDVGIAAANDFADPRLQFFLINFGKNLANEATPMELTKKSKETAQIFGRPPGMGCIGLALRRLFLPVNDQFCARPVNLKSPKLGGRIKLPQCIRRCLQDAE